MANPREISFRKFPEVTRFLEYYIGLDLASTTYRLDINTYNLKAPNFRQDIGYIKICERSTNLDIKREEVSALVKANQLSNSFNIFIVVGARGLEDLLDPLELYISYSLGSSFRNLIKIYPKNEYTSRSKVEIADIRAPYIKILIKEGYRVEPKGYPSKKYGYNFLTFTFF